MLAYNNSEFGMRIIGGLKNLFLFKRDKQKELRFCIIPTNKSQLTNNCRRNKQNETSNV